MIEQYNNKNIALLGLGVEGIATGMFFLEHNISFTILDRKTKEELLVQYPDAIALFEQNKVSFVCGESYLRELNRFDFIFRTPGMNSRKPEIQEAVSKGTIVSSHTKLFFDLCPCPIIGVTGTKGKGTTSTLIYEMLKQSNYDAYLGGNIGSPPLGFLSQLTPKSKVVLELSSFQLEDMTKSPNIAVMLMVTSEHLQAFGDQNFHVGISDYIAAKRNILSFQKSDDYAIINRDYPASNESDIYTEGKVYFISRERETGEGCFLKDKTVYLRINEKDQKIIDVQNIALLGKHNVENVCAAVMAASLAGATLDAIVSVLRSFTGLEHRLEFVAEVNGVSYYDDSFSTTPETAIAAIESFDRPKILILGGSHKGSDFTELGRIISHSSTIKAIIGIGMEWAQIKSKINSQNSKIEYIEDAKNMKEIVLDASEIAEPGDIVLLSPACASFGMFENYKDRGEQFKNEVKRLMSNS